MFRLFSDRSILLVALLGSVALTIAVRAEARQAEPAEFVGIYDLRDLAAVLPPPAPPGAGAPPSRGAGYGIVAPPDTGALGVFKPAEPVPGAVERLVQRLCGPAGMSHELLADGVFAVWGSREAHTELADQLRQVRALYSERYEIALSCVVAGPGQLGTQAWKIGQEMAPEPAVLTTRQVVFRRQSATIRVVSSHTVLADVDPVTGDQAMGYDPTTEVIDEGLTVTVLVGAGEERAEGTPLLVRGELTRVNLDKVSGPLGGRPDISFTIDLPVVQRRSIESSVIAGFGRPTAVAVLDGFSDDETIVLIASVRKLD